VWFAGVHAEVGGGYPEAESGLSKIALEWMAREAKAAGMIVDDDVLEAQLGYKDSVGTGPHARPDPAAMLHRSLKSFWWMLEILPRRQWNPEDHKMHWSWCAFQRSRTPVPIQIGHSFQLMSDSCRSEATLWV